MESNKQNENSRRNDDNTALKDYSGFDKVIDLSISQVFIMIMLSSFPGGTVRYNVLKSVNSYLSPNKKISASSFYNSLKKLEKMQLIEISSDKTDKASLVHTTSNTNKALKQIGSLISVTGLNFSEILPSLATQIVNQLGIVEEIGSILVISQDIAMDVHLYPFVEQYAEHINAVASDESYNRYILPYSSKVHQTRILNNKIREPDNEFNGCLLPTYQRRKEFFNLSSIELLKEAVRVTKTNGLVAIISFNIPNKTNHFIIDSFIDMINLNPSMVSVTENEVQSDLITAGLKNVSVSNFNGVILGFGNAP
ncbi:MAG: hypothetical protein ACW964_01415 [Candidatus Hodarchaeales archaeon]